MYSACICMRAYMHMYVCVYAYLCVRICICMCAYMHIYVCVYPYVCVYICIFMCAYMHMYVCVYAYVCVHICMCAYMHMYVCVYAYVCVRVYNISTKWNENCLILDLNFDQWFYFLWQPFRQVDIIFKRLFCILTLGSVPNLIVDNVKICIFNSFTNNLKAKCL